MARNKKTFLTKTKRMTNKRKTIAARDKGAIFSKTSGLCHFCGTELIFNAKRGEQGRWNVDHILPFSREGKDCLENYLPICKVCNRLRWNFESGKIRELLRYGIIAHKLVAKKTRVGKEIRDIYNKKIESNKKRRKGDYSESYYR
ncbi:MAG: hypothetical protein UT43_C0020G0010 [Parcubacteria group bacterium GW2011_GWC1_39_29]|nr:MAG: hypothetical protein UT43_C0020G0010 [Parcubacteria group bacterium GW2011_GWC1_39_29]